MISSYFLIIIIILIFLNFLTFIDGNSVKRERPRRESKNDTTFQVFNHPISGRRITKFVQKENPVITAPIVQANTTINPFLDFPDSDFEEIPILDFPNPIETEALRRRANYSLACKTEGKKETQEKITKNIKKQHKPVTEHEVRTQNRILQQALAINSIENVPIPEHHPKNGWKILEQSARIFETICKKKYIRTDFISTAIYAFKKLHYQTTPDRTEYIGNDKFKWMTTLLDKCGNESKGFIFFQDHCKEDIQAWKKEKNWLCTQAKQDLILPAYDPLLDIIWHIYNGIYYYCFNYFQDSNWLLHTYSHLIMDLYTSPIKLRWKHQMEDEEFWTRILGPNFLVYARNVERCAQAAVENGEARIFMNRYTTHGSVRLSSSSATSSAEVETI